MISAIALLLTAQTAPLPPFPPGSSAAVHQACLAVEEQLAKGAFEEARKDAERLPKRSFSIQWDDSAAPASEKDRWVEMRDLAIKSWSQIYNLHVSVGTKGDIAFRFVDHCPDGKEGIPAASVLQFGDSPRLKVDIGLKRGKQLEPIVPNEAFVEVAHAIGSYLGVADDPLLGSAMHREDKPGMPPYGPAQKDLFVAENILAISERLRRDVANRTSIPAGEPAIGLSPAVVDMGEVRAGSKVPLEFRISNLGTATLAINLVPDCGCFSRVPPGGVPPGKTVTLRTVVDTTEYIGTIHKDLVLYSNDPKNPTIEIPVTFKSLPAYRIYRPEGDTVIVPDSGTSINVLLTLPKDSKLFPERYEVTGMDNAKVTMEPWRGSAPDPDLDEPSQPRQGYEFHLKVPGKLPVGRTGLTLSVTTSDKDFPLVQYNLYLQKGIVALPENIFLSNMTGTARAEFRLTRHGKPFQILKVETGSPNLKAFVKPVTGQVEYQVDLLYDGHAPLGDFVAVVKVHTNDAKDPIVEVQVTGTVR